MDRIGRGLRGRAASIVAISEHLPQALWATLIEEFQLQAVMDTPVRLERRGMLSNLEEFEWTWLDAESRLKFEKQLAQDAPTIWKRAHVLAARFHAQRESDDDLCRAIDHWLVIGERRNAVRLLERSVQAEGKEPRSPSITRAVARVVQGMAAVPTWLRVLHARILERDGALEKSLESYEDLLATVDTTSPAMQKAHWAALAGHLALRIGHIRRAKRLCNMGQELAQGTTLPELLSLEARLALAREDLPRAERFFRKAEKRAEQLGDREGRAEARSGLGVVAMRAGKPHEAIVYYRRALAACGGKTSRTARVIANLAMALMLTGEHEEAIELFEEAIRMREQLGEVLGVANSLAALAEAREAVGDQEGAGRDLARARHLASRADDNGLVLEIHLLQARQAIRRGEISAARTEWQRAVALRHSLEHIDPLILAMMEETAAELELVKRRFVKAHGHARAALRILRKNKAHYWATRVRILLARLTFSAHRPLAALRHLHVVAQRVATSKFVFPTTHIDSRLLELGTKSTNEATIRFCQARLGTAQVLQRKSPTTLRTSTGVRVLDRAGARWVDQRDVDLLRQTPPDLLLDGPKQQLVIHGNVTNLGARRLLLPLLLLFLEHPTRTFEAWEIHRDVWSQDVFDDSSALRVRVALCRLRSLVGTDVIVTQRVTGTTGGTRTRYGLSERIDYAVIDVLLAGT